MPLAAAARGTAPLLGDLHWTEILAAAVVLVLSLVLAKLLSLYLRRLLRERVQKAHREMMAKAVYYGVAAAAAVVVLSTLGVDLSGLLVAGGVAGVIVGFASQRILGNLVSGLFLFLERPMKIGDAVSVEGQGGIVRDIRIFSTVLRGFDGLAVRIPNEKVFTARITNYVAHAARRFDFDLTVRYQDDADRALDLLRSLADEHPFVLHSPAPEIFVAQLDETGVRLSVLAWGPTSGWWGAKKDLIDGARKAFRDEGIEIAAPRRQTVPAPRSRGRKKAAAKPKT